MDNAKIRVLGFGNTLHGNDGFAEQVLNKFQQQKKAKCDVHFVGVAGLGALRWFDNCDELIVVDIVQTQVSKAPLAWYEPQEVIGLSSEHTNAHAQGLDYLLQAVLAVHDSPPLIHCLLCACDKTKAFHIGLSTSTQQYVDHAVEMIKQLMMQRVREHAHA